MILNANSIVQHNSKQKWNNKAFQCEQQKYHKCGKNYSWSNSTCICENSKYFKHFDDTSVTKFDDFVKLSTRKTNTIVTKKTNTIATNFTSTISINCPSKK